MADQTSSFPLPPANRSTLREEIGERADTVWTRGQGAPSIVPPRSPRVHLRGPHGRVAIIDGCRTPFCKSGGALRDMDVVDLAGVAAGHLVGRAIDPKEIDLSIFGVVIPALNAPNLGREVVFRASLPMRIPGTTVNLACASSNRAITFGAEAILAGEADVVLCGGAESLSNVPLTFGKRAARRFMELAKAKTLGQRLGLISGFRPRDFAPVAPAIAEYTTGMTMGQACEKMAKENDVSRRAQDELALMSHQRAAHAQSEGWFSEQIAPTFAPPAYDTAVLADNGVRGDSNLEALAKTPPAFDRRYGSLTAGNSSLLTDGGAAVC